MSDLNQGSRFGQQINGQRRGRFWKGKKNGQQRNDGGVGNQSFSGFQNMQYPPQLFQFPQQMQQIPVIQQNPQFQHNRAYLPAQKVAQTQQNQTYLQGQQNQKQPALVMQPQQNFVLAQQTPPNMMQQVDSQNPDASYILTVRSGPKFCGH